jgi:fructose-1,6-bisphosphatase II
MEQNLALEFVRVTEAAAISAAKWIGRGDKNAADQVAVDEMRNRLNQIHFSGEVVIGEGSKDEAPMLYTGEKVGTGSGLELDLAIDPLECTDSVAYGRYNAMAVIASGNKGSLLHAPDTYMEKIAVGPLAKHAIDINASVKTNIENVAKALGKTANEVTIILLDRPRHKDLLDQIRSTGARARLITDGDVAAAISTCVEESGIDMLMGIGGSTEAVLAAAAVKILGGEILCKFKPRNDNDLEEVKKAGITDLNKIFTIEDLAKGDELTFTATGVIEGPILPGVQFKNNKIITHSVVMRGLSKTIRYITTHHHQRTSE